MGLSGHLFFRVISSLQIYLKRLSPQIPLLQTTRHLQASCNMIRDPNWGLGGPKCVKTIQKHHKLPPPKYPQTRLETFFFGSFFTPNRRKTAKSPSPPLQTTRHLLASQRVITDPNWDLEVPKCVNTIRKQHKYPPQSIPKHIWKLFFSGHFSPQIAQKRLSPQPSPCRLLGPYWPHAG